MTERGRTSTANIEALNTLLDQGMNVAGYLGMQGVRIVRVADPIIKGCTWIGYGPSIEIALDRAAENYLSGGSTGKATPSEGLNPDDHPSSPLDSWVLKGKNFELTKEGESVRLLLVGNHGGVYTGSTVAEVIDRVPISERP